MTDPRLAVLRRQLAELRAERDDLLGRVESLIAFVVLRHELTRSDASRLIRDITAMFPDRDVR